MKNTKAILDTPRRMDFVLEPEATDQKNGVVHVLMKPDPRRHERITVEGEEYYRDVFLNELVSVNAVHEQMESKLQNLPIHNLSPRIESSTRYAEARNAALKQEMLSGTYVGPDETPRDHKGLEPSEDRRWIGFVSVDICKSTHLSVENQQNYAEAYELFFREMGTLVGQFNGEVFKATGDGYVAFIDHPSFTRVADNLIDFGMSSIALLERSINPNLESRKLPKLLMRVGAECGWATIGKLEVAATGFSSVDISSIAINQAVKIEGSAGVNQLRIGQALYATSHIDWMLRCEETSFDGNLVGDDEFKVYSVC